MNGRGSTEREYIDLSVGIVEVNIEVKYNHMWELLKDFSGQAEGVVDNKWDGNIMSFFLPEKIEK